MRLYKFFVLVVFISSIESVQLAIAGSPLTHAAVAKVLKESGRFGLQQARSIRTKPARSIKRKTSLKPTKVPQVLDYGSSWASWDRVKQVAASSKDALMSCYEQAQSLAVHKTQQLHVRFTGNIVENKVASQEGSRVIDHCADKVVQAAKTDATQAASGLFNRNATTNNVTYTTNHYYAKETLAQTLTKDPEKAKILKVGAAVGAAGTTLFIGAIKILKDLF